MVSADGSGDRPIEDSPGIAYDQALSDVSNDGTRVVVTYRDASDASEQSLVVRVNGDGPPVELTCDKTGPDACAPGTNVGSIRGPGRRTISSCWARRWTTALVPRRPRVRTDHADDWPATQAELERTAPETGWSTPGAKAGFPPSSLPGAGARGGTPE